MNIERKETGKLIQKTFTSSHSVLIESGTVILNEVTSQCVIWFLYWQNAWMTVGNTRSDFKKIWNFNLIDWSYWKLWENWLIDGWLGRVFLIFRFYLRRVSRFLTKFGGKAKTQTSLTISHEKIDEWVAFPLYLNAIFSRSMIEFKKKYQKMCLLIFKIKLKTVNSNFFKISSWNYQPFGQFVSKITPNQCKIVVKPEEIIPACLTRNWVKISKHFIFYNTYINFITKWFIIIFRLWQRIGFDFNFHLCIRD